MIRRNIKQEEVGRSPGVQRRGLLCRHVRVRRVRGRRRQGLARPPTMLDALQGFLSRLEQYCTLGFRIAQSRFAVLLSRAGCFLNLCWDK